MNIKNLKSEEIHASIQDQRRGYCLEIRDLVTLEFNSLNLIYLNQILLLLHNYVIAISPLNTTGRQLSENASFA